jgi:hypothetical protein
MYAFYERTQQGSGWRYRYLQDISLFGCRKGQIPLLLRKNLPTGQGEPYRWHIEVPVALNEPSGLNKTIIIDAKPSQRQTKLSLYELLDVWGYSSRGWTPVMMRMRGLFVDGNPVCADYRDFAYDLPADDPIFSVMYLAGSVANGNLTDRWTAPGPSSTNGVLMWPPVMEYFSAEAARVMKAKNG